MCHPKAFVAAVKAHQARHRRAFGAADHHYADDGATRFRHSKRPACASKVKIMVGGAPVDGEFAKRIGADGYGSNAPAGAELAKARGLAGNIAASVTIMGVI
jgi:hypothetical protein